MNGSGFPMRFADLDGRVLDIYQAASHLVNENGIDQRAGIDAMLDRALGPEQFFGAFGTHYDYTDGYFDHLVAAARERGVAMISAAQMLRWLDRREATRFEALAWNGHDLTFRVDLAEGPERMTGMLPVSALSHRLAASPAAASGCISGPRPSRASTTRCSTSNRAATPSSTTRRPRRCRSRPGCGEAPGPAGARTASFGGAHPFRIRALGRDLRPASCGAPSPRPDPMAADTPKPSPTAPCRSSPSRPTTT